MKNQTCSQNRGHSENIGTNKFESLSDSPAMVPSFRGCAARPSPDTRPRYDLGGCPTEPGTLSDAGGVKKVRYGPGQNGVALEAWYISGQGHLWPGGEEPPLPWGGRTHQLQSAGIERLSRCVDKHGFAESEDSLLDPRDRTLDHDKVVVDHAVPHEATHADENKLAYRIRLLRFLLRSCAGTYGVIVFLVASTSVEALSSLSPWPIL